QAAAISVDLELERVTGADLLEPIRIDDNLGWMRFGGRASHGDQHPGSHFECQLSVIAKGGTVRQDGHKIVIHAADSVLVLISADSDPDGNFDMSLLRGIHDKVKDQPADNDCYPGIFQRHVVDHSALMGRVDLQLGNKEKRQEPTDERIRSIRNGNEDVDLIATFFQFGRYLQIASSRPGCLPANLQGLWNHHISAPWNSDYHTNINLQMNYWPVEVANLAECHEPLFDFIDGLVARGEETARELYDAPGWVAHHTSDVHAFTVPIGRTVWGLWPLGGAWLCRHLWEHYQYGGDEHFLRERAWPVLRGACEFFVAYLVEDPVTGKLVSGPSSSPENSYRTPDGQVADVGMGNAMDQQIIWDLFTMTLNCAEILSIDEEFVSVIQKSRDQLSRSVIGEDGRILEWSRPWQEVEPGHRHMSHLYALHPGEEWTLDESPEYIEAARRSIEYRLSHGGGHTGWSRAWLLNFFARLGDGEKVAESLQLQLAKSTLPNLLDDHPPFQIDGNFGATAGIAEALVQSHGGVLRLLPALPSSWARQGHVRGLRTRFGVEVSMEWNDDQLVTVRLKPTRNQRIPVRWGEQKLDLRAQKGREILLNVKEGQLTRIASTQQ
ncbi:MAG: glycoside hydrolase family 95-like protein, partial [Planctomycetota bacterium]